MRCAVPPARVCLKEASGACPPSVRSERRDLQPGSTTGRPRWRFSRLRRSRHSTMAPITPLSSALFASAMVGGEGLLESPSPVPSAGGLTKGQIIGIGAGAGGGVIAFVLLGAAALWWRNRGREYYAYDFAADAGSVQAGSVADEEDAASTKAMRGGASQKSVPRDSFFSRIGDRSSRAAATSASGRRARALPRDDSAASAASDGEITAPALQENEHIGGSGVGFLDGFGRPIVRRKTSVERERNSGSDGSSIAQDF